MDVKQLIDILECFNKEDIVILGDLKTGWSNIDKVKQDGSCVSITMDLDDSFHSK